MTAEELRIGRLQPINLSSHFKSIASAFEKRPMVLILSESDVSTVLNMSQGVRLIEQAFADYAAGHTILLPRVSQALPSGGGAFRVMAAVLPRANRFGLKTLTGYPGRRLPGETYFAVLLFEMKTGALRAVMAANHLTGIRTGAATGVATKYLAKEHASVLGVFGAGVQARHQVTAIFEVRPIKLVKVFDVNRTTAAAFADWITCECGVAAAVSPSSRETVAGSDVIVTATTSLEPLFASEWLEPGTLVNGVGANAAGKQELDAPCFAMGKVVVDFKAQALEEAGDLRHAISTGAISAEKIHAELGEIVVGNKKGRENDTEITLFKSVGVAIEDIATASFVYEKAMARGIGTMVHFGNRPVEIAAAPDLPGNNAT
jgi:alanine dehydrogenase